MGLNVINERFIATCRQYGISAENTEKGVIVTDNGNTVELVVEVDDEISTTANINFYRTETTTDEFVSKVFNIYTIVAEQEA